MKRFSNVLFVTGTDDSAALGQGVTLANNNQALFWKVANIITCGPEGGVGPKSTQLVTFLRFRGIKSERITLRENNDAKAIIKGCKELQSDLLVMVAFSRSRLRQRILGGLTESMLHRTIMPVLMLPS